MRRLLLRFVLGGLLFLTLSRLGLSAWQWDRVVQAGGLWPVLAGGLRIDLVMLGMMTVVPAALSPWLGHRPGAVAAAAWWLRLCWLLLVLLEVSTPQFLAEYDTRPNRLYFEYLVHPHEVAAMLWHGYKLQIGIALAALAAFMWLVAWLLPVRGRVDARMGMWRRPVVSLVLVAVAVMAIRGTLQHRPINPSTVAFSSDAMVNALALNSFYNVTHAAYRMKDERAADALYGEMDPAESTAIVRAAAGLGGPPMDVRIPTLHRQVAGSRRDRPLNLVIIVEESLGAQFVSSLGGRDLTPNLDALGRQGWMFGRAYATGTRSVRGLEALTTGFLPTPAEAVLKLPRAQSGFFTIAGLLGEHGYHSRFVYGGEAHFDNMRGFFLANGFDEVVDGRRFVDPVFTGSWGASDEDMFRQLDRLLRAGGDQPTFTLAFTVSNHSPWEYPPGRIQPVGDPASNENAVRYADWALGQFFKVARGRPYWRNTLFLVVADHDARVFGANLVPVRHFQIPALILGADVRPRRDDRLVSQIDLAPTLLSLMGIDCVHPMLGQDLTQRSPNRAMMQYGDNYGYLKGDELVVLEPDKAPRQFRYMVPDSYHERPLDPALAREALAHATWPSWAYSEERYRRPLPSGVRRAAGGGDCNGAGPPGPPASQACARGDQPRAGNTVPAHSPNPIRG